MECERAGEPFEILARLAGRKYECVDVWMTEHRIGSSRSRETVPWAGARMRRNCRAGVLHFVQLRRLFGGKRAEISLWDGGIKYVTTFFN